MGNLVRLLITLLQEPAGVAVQLRCHSEQKSRERFCQPLLPRRDPSLEEGKWGLAELREPTNP